MAPLDETPVDIEMHLVNSTITMSEFILSEYFYRFIFLKRRCKFSCTNLSENCSNILSYNEFYCWDVQATCVVLWSLLGLFWKVPDQQRDFAVYAEQI